MTERTRTMLAAAATAASAILAFHGALGGFFCQDDFDHLARAAGVSTAPPGVWRFVSHTVFFELLWPFARLDAPAYFAVVLALHALSAVLVLLLLRRHTSAEAAWIGATFFAAHPAMFRAVHWLSASGDVLALAFLLAAWHTGRRLWIALPLYAASLLSKEVTILWPLVLVAERRRVRDPLVLGAGAVAVVFCAALWLSARSGAGALPGGEAYALTPDSRALHNVLTYLGWTIAIPVATLRSGWDVYTYDTIQRSVFPAGVALLAAWIAGCAWRPARSRGWIVAGVAFAAFLAPVVPLGVHTYRYYIYVPLLGAAWCVAALADTIRLRGRARLWAAAAIAVALTANGAAFAVRMRTSRLPQVGQPTDPTIRRAFLARNVRDDLAAAPLPAGVRLYMWSPASLRLDRQMGRTPLEGPSKMTIWEENVAAALEGGIGVRVFFPHLREVRFVHEFEPAGDSVWYAVYDVDGHVKTATAPQVEALRRQQTAQGESPRRRAAPGAGVTPR
jgi:hypothetical protein